MTLTIQFRVQADGKRIGRKRREYRLDGKVISAEQAQELMQNPDVKIVDKTDPAYITLAYPDNSTLNAIAHTYESKIFYRTVSDALTALREVEMYLPEFVIDHSVLVEGGVFASNKDGDTLKLYDDRLEVFKKRDGTTTVYTFDIAESRFIKELQKVGDTETFEITGDSGITYKFGKDYELLTRDEETVQGVETLTNYIFNRRKSAKNKARAA
ncbi:MAG: hypothetical protein IJU91_00915 [Selenomonadaceae bacterium]|nr:hypothetical protein [Selenomonadaceae bacterium]